MLKKVLVANRGEIAIRAFRAAYELGIRTVAVCTPEDRGSLHRQEADEAYKIGEVGHPVRAYLDIEMLVGTAERVGADAIYPGYGFLSESAAFSQACEEDGLTLRPETGFLHPGLLPPRRGRAGAGRRPRPVHKGHGGPRARPGRAPSSAP